MNSQKSLTIKLDRISIMLLLFILLIHSTTTLPSSRQVNQGSQTQSLNNVQSPHDKNNNKDDYKQVSDSNSNSSSNDSIASTIIPLIIGNILCIAFCCVFCYFIRRCRQERNEQQAIRQYNATMVYVGPRYNPNDSNAGINPQNLGQRFPGYPIAYIGQSQNNMVNINNRIINNQWTEVTEQQKIILMDNTCSICLQESTNCQTICKHRFHFKCLDEWIRRRFACPACNQSQINPVKLICQKCYNKCSLEYISPNNFMQRMIFQNQGQKIVCRDCLAI